MYCIHNTATDRRCARSHSNTPPVKKLSPLTTRSSSLRCVSAAEHQTEEQYSKTGKTKPYSISQEAVYHGILARISSRYQAVEKLLWKKSEDASQKSLLTERRCFSRSSSLRCVSSAEHHTAEQYSKTGRTKPRKHHLSRSDLSWNTRQDTSARQETIQTNKPPKHYTQTGSHNISSSLKKKRKHTQWVSATIKVQV